MNQLNLHYLIWHAKTSAKSLGVWGLLGLFLLLASITFYFIKVGEVKHNIQLAKIEQQNQVKKNDAINNQHENEAPLNAAEEVAQFYSRFPSMEELPKILSELNQIAKNQGIEIDVGDYRLNAIKSSSSTHPRELTKYDVTFPLQGKYSQIRAFIAETLEKFPEIALMDLQVIREGTTTSSVEATIVFAVYVKVTK